MTVRFSVEASWNSSSGICGFGIQPALSNVVASEIYTP